MDTLLDNPDMEYLQMAVLLFGMESIKQVTPVVTAEHVSETKSLPQGTSAQLPELVALTRALELSKRAAIKYLHGF